MPRCQKPRLWPDNIAYVLTTSGADQLAFHHPPGQRQPVVLLQSGPRGREQPVRDRQQPGFALRMPATIDGNGFQAEIDRGEMAPAGDAGLAQDRRGQQPAEPWRMLQHLQRIPGIQENNRPQHWWQIFGFRQDYPPLVGPLILIQSRS